MTESDWMEQERDPVYRGDLLISRNRERCYYTHKTKIKRVKTRKKKTKMKRVFNDQRRWRKRR